MGNTLSLEKAIQIKELFEEKRSFISMEEILMATNSRKTDANSLKKLIIDNLPVVVLKERTLPEKFVDARNFLRP